MRRTVPVVTEGVHSCICSLAHFKKYVLLSVPAGCFQVTVLLVANTTIEYVKPEFLHMGESVDVWPCLETFLTVESGAGDAPASSEQ